MSVESRPTFEYPDASGVVRTWMPKCGKCDKVPTKCVDGKRYHEVFDQLERGADGIPISDYGALYCEDHAPHWAVPIDPEEAT